MCFIVLPYLNLSLEIWSFVGRFASIVIVLQIQWYMIQIMLLYLIGVFLNSWSGEKLAKKSRKVKKSSLERVKKSSIITFSLYKRYFTAESNKNIKKQFHSKF